MRLEAAKRAVRSGSEAEYKDKYAAQARRENKRDQKHLCIDEAYSELLRFRYWNNTRDIKHWLNNDAWGLFADIHWTSDEEQCNMSNNTIDPPERYLFVTPELRPCVKPFCKHDHCSDVEDALNRISRQAGIDADWTTDTDDATPSNVPCKYTMHATPSGKPAPQKRIVPPTQSIDNTVTSHRLNDVRNVCLTTATEKLGKYFGPDVTERLVSLVWRSTRWTSNLDDCSPRAITESQDYHHKLIDNDKRKTKHCLEELSPLVDPEFNSTDIKKPCQGKTCRRLKKDLNTISKDIGEHWEWTDDDDYCPYALGFNTDSDFPTICRELVGDDTADRLRRYWGEDYQVTLEEIYPDAIFNIGLSDVTDCEDEKYSKAAKTWIHDHRVGGKRKRRCVEPYCRPYYNADCSDVEDDLETVSKAIGHHTDWTTDDDACPKDTIYPPLDDQFDDESFFYDPYSDIPVHNAHPSARAAHPINSTSHSNRKRNSPEHALDKRFTHMEFSICFAERCKNHPEDTSCPTKMRIKFAQLEEMSDSQIHVLNDERVCRGAKPHSRMCSKVVCTGHTPDECEEAKQEVLDEFSSRYAMDFAFTDDNDLCGPALARAALDNLPADAKPKPKSHKSSRLQPRDETPPICRQSYCGPYISRVNCAAFERDFNAAYAGAASVTGDLEPCDNAPMFKHMPRYTKDGKQVVCVRELCGRLGAPAGSDSYTATERKGHYGEGVLFKGGG